MPIYTVEGPDKRTYEIEGPEGATLDQLVAVIQQQGPSFQAPKPTVGGYIKEALKGVPAGAIGLLETAAVGASSLLPEEAEKVAREKIQEIAGAARKPFEAAPGYEETIPRKAGEAVGSTGPFFAAAPLGLAGRAAIGALASGAGAGEARLRAEAAQATPEERAQATGLGTVVGISELLAPFGVGNVVGRVKRAALAGGIEGAQEAAAEIAQNAIARGVYDPSQNIIVGAGEAGAYGAGVGAFVQAILDMALPGRARGAAPAPTPAVSPTPTPEEAATPQLSLFTPEQTPAMEAPPEVVERQEAEQKEAQQAASKQRLDELRNEFDTLQRENERLKATGTEEARAEAEKIAPALKDLQTQIKETQKELPAEERGRPAAPEEQLELAFDDRIRIQDLVQLGIPMEGGTPVQVGVRGWLRDNVLGKTPEQVRGLVKRQPDLVKGEGLRARVIRQIVTPEPAAYEEPRREPSVSGTPEQGTLDLGGVEPSVDVPSEPARVRGRARERVVPPAEPTTVEPTGLADIEPDVGVGVGKQAEPTPAVTPPPELREGTNKVLGDLWEDYKPENAPTLDKLPDYVQSQWLTRVSESMKPGARGLSLTDTERVFDKALENVGYELYNARMEPSKDAEGKIIKGLLFRTDQNGKVAQDIYEQLTPEARAVADDYANKYEKIDRKDDQIIRKKEEAEEKQRKAIEAQQRKEEREAAQERERESKKAAKQAEGKRGKAVAVPEVEEDVELRKGEQELVSLVEKAPTRKERRKPLQRAAAPTPAPAPAPAPEAKAEPTPGVSFIQGTPEQIKQAEAHAKDLGGKVVALEGDYGLVQGYSVIHGRPVYLVTSGRRRSMLDIDSYTGKDVLADVKARLSAIKKQLEEDEAAKHAKDPFIKFGADDVALSDDIPAEYENIIREWKKLLKLDVPIYVSTIEDARKNKDNFTGPHRAIGSSTLDPSEAGSTRRMEDGSYYILFDKSAKKTKTLEILAHEMGHIHQRVAFDNASDEQQLALREAHEEWLKSLKGKTARDLVQSMRGRATQRFVEGDLNIPSEKLSAYWRSFGEWYADQTARWALSADKPVTIVEKFFARLGAALRKFYNGLKAKDYLPNETFANYIEAVIARPAAVNFAPDKVGADEAASPMTTRVSSEELAEFDKGANPIPGGTSRQLAQEAIDNVTKFRTIVADKAATVSDAIAKDFNKGAESAIKDKATEAVYRQAESSDQLLPAVFRLGVVRLDPKTKLWKAESVKGIKSVQEIFQNDIAEWGKSKGMSFNEAYNYGNELLAAARENEFRRLNKTQEKGRLFPVSMSDADIDRLYAEYKKDKGIQTIKESMDKLRFANIDNLVRTGRITKEMGDDWKAATDYVPFDRVEDMDATFRTQRRVGRGISQLGTTPELVNAAATKRPPKNVFDNYINLIGWMTQQTVRQDATLRTLRALEDIGQAKYVGRRKPAEGEKSVKVYINGEEGFFLTPSTYHVAAFNTMAAPTLGVVKLMSQFSRVLRTAITAVPTFTAAQLPQDIQRAIIASGVRSPVALTAKVLGNFKEFGKAAALGKLDDITGDLPEFGVLGGVDFHVSNPSESFLQSLGVKERTAFKSSKFGELLHRLQGIALASDIAVRKAIYDQTLEETQGDKLLALQRAREIINFRRYGMGDKLGLIHLATQTVPFYNAYLQGMDVLYRSLTGREAPSGLARNAALKLYWTNIGYLMGATVLYSLMMAGDDEYDNMDPRERDKTWVIGNGIGIPVPSEIGMVFKAIPERVLDYYRKEGTSDEIAATEAVISWTKAAANEYFGRTVPVPVAVKPLLENFVNYSFFTGRSLEGIFQQQLLPSERVTSRTSELAKEIAQFTAQTAGVELSPIQIDNVLRGYLGTTGALTLAVADQLIKPGKTDTPLHQMVGLTPFAYDPVGTRRINEFYDLREKVVQTQMSLNQMMKSSPERAAAFADKNANILAAYKMVNSTLNELEKTRAYKQFLDTEAAAQSMDSAERLKMKQDVQKYEQELVDWVRTAKKQLGI